MPFVLPNQQRQSTEGKIKAMIFTKLAAYSAPVAKSNFGIFGGGYQSFIPLWVRPSVQPLGMTGEVLLLAGHHSCHPTKSFNEMNETQSIHGNHRKSSTEPCPFLIQQNKGCHTINAICLMPELMKHIIQTNYTVIEITMIALKEVTSNAERLPSLTLNNVLIKQKKNGHSRHIRQTITPQKVSEIQTAVTLNNKILQHIFCQERQ